MATNSIFLEHYGRKGMKWGQHIFGKEKNYRDAETVIKSLKKTDYSDFGTPDPKRVYDYRVKKVKGTPKAFGMAIRGNRNGLTIVDLSLAVSPDSRGKGYATELANKMIQKALNDPKVSKIYWAAKKDNLSSIELANKLGFTGDYETDYYKILSMQKRRR